MAKKVKKRSSNAAGLHAIAIIAATCAFFLLPFLSGETFLSRFSGEGAAIGIEHKSPLTLGISLGIAKGGQAILEFSAEESAEEIFLSLPEAWELWEVRGSAMKDVSSDAPAFGFVRWRVPPAAGLSFQVLSVPASLNAHNPSGVPVKIRLTAVNIETEKVTRNVILMKDAEARIW